MKRFFVLAMLLFPAVVIAEPVTTLFSNITGTAANDLKRSEAKDHTVFCNYTNVGGSATALTVNLNGSIDNDNFVGMASHAFTAAELSSRKAMFHALDMPVPSVMGNISTVIDTGTTYVGCKYWPFRTPNR